MYYSKRDTNKSIDAKKIADNPEAAKTDVAPEVSAKQLVILFFPWLFPGFFPGFFLVFSFLSWFFFFKYILPLLKGRRLAS